MKTARKAPARRKVIRRAAPLSLSARIERLEKVVLFPAVKLIPAAPISHFTKLDASGKPTTGAHVAVHDARTGLIWTAEPVQGGKTFKHADALKACTEVDLLGEANWRAPTIQELLSIVDYERWDPAVDVEYFKGPYGWIWSSTVSAGPSGYAWSVYLDDGDAYRFNQGFYCFVRAVRAGQPLSLGL